MLDELRQRLVDSKLVLRDKSVGISTEGGDVLAPLSLRFCDKVKVYALIDRFLLEYLAQKRSLALG